MSGRESPRWGANLAGKGRWWSRPSWAIIASCSLWVLALAYLLKPAPEGVGTHTQLGLAPCTFLVVTGLPCPSCGLTTCFTHMVRLQLIDALTANGPGVLLFLVVVALIPISLVGMVRDMPVVETLSALRGELVALTLAAASLVGWLIELGLTVLF